MRSIPLIPALLLVSLGALAADEKDCGAIRLDRDGGPFAEMPVYDQRAFADDRDTGICYAVAAAQLIDAERFRQEGKKPRQLTAPVSLALTAKWKSLGWFETETVKDGRVEEAMSLGEVRKALDYARISEICDQNWLDQFEASFGAEEKYPRRIPAEYAHLFPSKRNFLRAITAEINRFRATPLPFLAGARGVRAVPEITEDFFSCKVEENVLPVKDILAAVEAGAAYATPLGQMREFLRSICAAHSFRPKIPEPKIFLRDTLSRRGDLDMEPYRTGEMARKVSELLDASPRPKPVAANFCYSALEKKGAGHLRDDRLGNYHPTNCVFHSALIIGRRFHPGRGACELLVRDSYGPGCRKPDGGDRYDWDCENGNVWIDARELMSATAQLTWL